MSYIDPTAGGVLAQIIFGGLGGAAVLFKLFWHRIRHSLTRLARRRGPDSSSVAPHSSPAGSTDANP